MNNRGRFIRVGLAASAGSAILGRPAAAAPWEAQWTDLIEAAKKEGRLSIVTIAGLGFRKWLQAAEGVLGVPIDHQQLPNSDAIANKVLAEREARIYSFDILVMAAVTALPRLKPVGALDPLRPLLFRPDVLDNKAWIGGFANNWSDNDKSIGFPLAESLQLASINTDLVGTSELKNARSLLDPKWKGRIILSELGSGATRVLMTSIRLRYGDDAVRRLVIDQKPTFARDPRQLAEGLVRGNYAIAHYVSAASLQEFVDAGLARNVKWVDIPDVSTITHTFSLWAVNKAPHPNARKLFANWVLTKEGEQLFSSNILYNTRRTDVAMVDPLAIPKPGQHYFRSSNEAAFAELEKTRALLTQITGAPA